MSHMLYTNYVIVNTIAAAREFLNCSNVAVDPGCVIQRLAYVSDSLITGNRYMEWHTLLIVDLC